MKAFSAFGSFPPFVGHFFKRAREPEVKLRHVVYEVWLVSYLFFSFQIWYFRKWTITSVGQSKHTRVTRFNPLWVPGTSQNCPCPQPYPIPLPPPHQAKKFPSMFTWQFRWSNVPLNSALKSVKSLTHQWQCKSFPMRSNNRLFICKYSETWLSAHLQDLPKGPLIRGFIEVCENRTMFVND